MESRTLWFVGECAIDCAIQTLTILNKADTMNARNTSIYLLKTNNFKIALTRPTPKSIKSDLLC